MRLKTRSKGLVFEEILLQGGVKKGGRMGDTRNMLRVDENVEDSATRVLGRGSDLLRSVRCIDA